MPSAAISRSAPSRRLRKDSDLSATILRMIALNSLAAFTQDVSRANGVGNVAPVRGPAATPAAPEVTRVAERRLDSVPPPPTGASTQRGLLLDMRV